MANSNDFSGYAQAAASMAASATSAIANSNLDKKNRQWQEQMYAQRLRDERANWNMQNEYNSPSAVASRMMSAGLNPDVSDIPSGSGVAGSVGSAGDQGSAPYQHSPLDFVGAFANVMEIVQGLESSRLDNQIKKAELDKLTKSTAMDYLVKNYDPNPDNSPFVGMSDIMNDSIRGSRSVSGLATYFRKQGLSRSAANQAARYVHTIDVNDVRSEYYRRHSDSDSNRKGYLSGRADPFYRDDDNSMVSTLNEFFSIQNELNSWIMKSQKSKAKYDSNYWNNRKSGQDAQNDSDMKGYQTCMAKQSFESGQNESAIDAQAEEWLKKIDNPIVQLIARFLFMKGKNFSFSGAGFRL